MKWNLRNPWIVSERSLNLLLFQLYNIIAQYRPYPLPCCYLKTGLQENRFLIQTTDAATRQFIQQAFCDQNAYLAQQFCDIKTREDQREIQALRDKLEQARTEAQTAVLLSAVNGTKCFNGRYDTTTSTICGSVGARNCCCNRIGTAPTPATTETDLEAETVPVRGKSKSKAE